MNADLEPDDRRTGRPEIDALDALLDRQLLDRDGLMVGKVDDLELEEREDGRLVVSALLIGPGALGPRIGGGSGSIVARSWARLSGRRESDADRVGFDRIASIDTVVRLGVTAESLAPLAGSEEWVRTRIIEALPGARKDPS